MDVYQTEEQQVEAIKGFWKEYGIAVIAGLVLGFAGFIGFNYYLLNMLIILIKFKQINFKVYLFFQQ